MERTAHPAGGGWLVLFGALLASFVVSATPDETEKGALRAALGRDAGLILKVHCSPDGKWLATAGQEGNVHVYDTKKWQEVKEFALGEHLWAVQFSPDSRILAAAGSGKIHRFQVGRKWKRLDPIVVPGMSLTFAGGAIQQGATIFDLAFHRSGKVIGAATENEKVQLFDPRTDPLCLTDLAANEPARVAELTAALDAYLAGLREREAERRAEFDAAERDALNDLGYVDQD